MSLLVVGSVAFDTIKTPVERRARVLGGSAVYFSMAAGNFTPVSIVAVVGKDFGPQNVKLLKRASIDIRGLEVADGHTFHWHGEYGKDFGDARTIATHLNVFADFKPKIPQAYKKIPHLFLANIDPELQSDVLAQVSSPRLVAVDTMNFWIKNKRKALLRLLKKVDIFFLNESEARQLSGVNNLVRAASAIIKLGPKRVIIKKGEDGAVLFGRQSAFGMPALPLDKITDPTGAGDTFAGGVMGHLARCSKVTDTNLRQAIVYGSAMAAFAVSDFSPLGLARLNKKKINVRVEKLKRFIRL